MKEGSKGREKHRDRGRQGFAEEGWMKNEKSSRSIYDVLIMIFTGGWQ